MQDEELEETTGNFFLSQHDTRCFLCEEGLYVRSVFHCCSNEDMPRLDIHICPECDWMIYRVDGEIQDHFPEELSCCCGEE